MNKHLFLGIILLLNGSFMYTSSKLQYAYFASILILTSTLQPIIPTMEPKVFLNKNFNPQIGFFKTTRSLSLPLKIVLPLHVGGTLCYYLLYQLNQTRA